MQIPNISRFVLKWLIFATMTWRFSGFPGLEASSSSGGPGCSAWAFAGRSAPPSIRAQINHQIFGRSSRRASRFRVAEFSNVILRRFDAWKSGYYTSISCLFVVCLFLFETWTAYLRVGFCVSFSLRRISNGLEWMRRSLIIWRTAGWSLRRWYFGTVSWPLWFNLIHLSSGLE